ncbi:MAG: hypothetical protein WKG00_25920 [Polyangiaceae bacterium]
MLELAVALVVVLALVLAPLAPEPSGFCGLVGRAREDTEGGADEENGGSEEGATHDNLRRQGRPRSQPRQELPCG